MINICEIKTSPKISNKIINEVQEKIERFDNPKGLTIISILISLYSPPKAIVDSGYFSCDLT